MRKTECHRRKAECKMKDICHKIPVTWYPKIRHSTFRYLQVLSLNNWVTVPFPFQASWSKKFWAKEIVLLSLSRMSWLLNIVASEYRGNIKLWLWLGCSRRETQGVKYSFHLWKSHSPRRWTNISRSYHDIVQPTIFAWRVNKLCYFSLLTFYFTNGSTLIFLILQSFDLFCNLFREDVQIICCSAAAAAAEVRFGT